MTETRSTGSLRQASLERWLSAPVEVCPCGRSHAVHLRDVLLGPGALDLVAELVPRPARGEGPILLLADANTHAAAGERVASALRAAGRPVRESILGRSPRADDSELERLRPALACRPCRLVAVGSGTIGDLGKALAREAGAPLVIVGTAASMNGYASSIAALTLSGLKVTFPAAPPRSLILDTRVLADAPERLTRAGFGDLCSKPVSSADWLLSNWLLGEPLCPTALSLADEAIARARAVAKGIGRAEAEAVGTLAEALVLSGLSMTVAGASSPASGGEHLISHFLDMSAKGWDREPRLHGEQVAVGTLASLALYRRLRASAPPDPASPEPPEATAEELAASLGHLSRPALDAVLRESGAKSSRAPGRLLRRRRVASVWNEMWQRLDAQLRASQGLREDLVAAGAPTSFAGIGVDQEKAFRLLRLARHIRNRYTVLDLGADIGKLDSWAEEISAELAG